MSEAYHIHTTIAPGMNPSDSLRTFDFTIVLDREEQLMSSSITMGSLWSIDSGDSYPPFPDRPSPPIAPILIDDRSMIHPFGLDKAGPDSFNILTSVATLPRMRNILLEPLCINRWVDMIIARAAPPGHIPWEAVAMTKESRWIPSGSFLSPGDFRRAFKCTRSAPRGFATFGSIRSRAKERQATSEQDHIREALTFERELRLNANGDSKRWSLRVPATTMDPEMVDIMLELQDLNSFFKESLEDLDNSVAVLEKEKDKLSSPTLKVPDPHHTLSPPTSSTRPQRQAIPLAARRGKSPPSPILLVDKPTSEPYPSIPTAFLGSPSTYSPQFEHNQTENRLSLDLMAMVRKLRSQCDSLSEVTDTDYELPAESPGSVMRPAAPSDQGNTTDEDDWAFAVSFFDELGGDVQVPQLDHSQNHTYEGSVHISGESIDGVKTRTAESEILHIQGPTCVPSSPCPSTPLPAAPLPGALVQHGAADLSSPPGTVRGILKCSKNVRFASLPEPERPSDGDTTNNSPFTPPPAATCISRGPSRNRAFSRSSREDVENTPQRYIGSRRSSDAQVGVKPKRVKIFHPASVISSTPDDPFQSKDEQGQISQLLVAHRASLTPSPAWDSNLIIRGRQSFGHSKKVDSPSIKGQQMSPSPRGKAGSRWTMNDMAFRRGSNASTQSPEVTPKSRMPVPLRNILTRFK